MKNLVLFVIFILALVIVQFAQAQTADEIIDKHLAARGGKDNLRGLRTIIMEGAKNVMNTDVMIKVIKVQDKLFRTNFEFGGNPGFMLLTPTNGWSFFPMRNTKPEELAPERVKMMQNELDIPGPLLDYASKGHRVEFQGEDMVNDVKAYKIKLTLNNGKETVYYIDAKTYLILQSKTSVENQKGEKTDQMTTYSDWKEFGKILFPQTINVEGTGMNAGITTFDKIAVNNEVNEKFYQPE